MAVLVQRPQTVDFSVTKVMRFLRKQTPAPSYLFLIPMAVFSMLPIVYVISTAFKPLEELLLFPPPFLVRRPTLTTSRICCSPRMPWQCRSRGTCSTVSSWC